MSQQTLWFVLDGKDAGRYSGEWRPTFDERAFRGTLMTATFNSSMANTSNAIMNFTFDGTAVILRGQSSPSDERESPRFPACTVDGEAANFESLGSSGLFEYSWNGTKATIHTLQLSARPQAGSVSVDSVRFLPRDNSRVPKNTLVELRHDNRRVDRTLGAWRTLKHEGSDAASTMTPNSTMNFLFIGTGAIAEGWRAPATSAGNSTATYSIDNGPSVAFNIQPSNLTEFMHNQEFFEITDLRPGYHRLQVTYLGPSTPLVLERFWVHVGDLGLSTPPSPTPTPSPASSKQSSRNTTVLIVLAVISVVVLSALVLWRYIWVCLGGRKRPKQTPSVGVELDHQQPLLPNPPPYQPPIDENTRSYPPPPPPYQGPSSSPRDVLPGPAEREQRNSLAGR